VLYSILLYIDTRHFVLNRISDLKIDFVIRCYTVFLILHVQVLRTEVLLYCIFQHWFPAQSRICVGRNMMTVMLSLAMTPLLLLNFGS
jgi:hypothetical protein